MKGKYLITTDGWFFGPDGRQYKAVWGEVEVTDDSVLGIKTNSRSTNWYVKVGTDDSNVIVAGCQIHYAVKCDDKPNAGLVKENHVHEGNVVENKVGSYIYIAE
jgi:hypothetical protein